LNPRQIAEEMGVSLIAARLLVFRVKRAARNTADLVAPTNGQPVAVQPAAMDAAPEKGHGGRRPGAGRHRRTDRAAAKRDYDAWRVVFDQRRLSVDEFISEMRYEEPRAGEFRTNIKAHRRDRSRRQT